MAKHVKMVLYGEPGVGKSVFASKAPKPFFICTDGNYEWLEDFGAKPEDHTEVFSWADAKSEFAKSFDGYETIVVDLTEDLFKWCEFEYCKKNKYEHVSDIGYGKGYDITRNEFFIEMCKLINKPKNVIFIMHGLQYVVKDRRGVEHTKYGPTNRLPDKVLDLIEGRVRYFLRCYLKAEETEGGQLVKRRYLSLVPKEDEYGILRGIDETTIPSDIPLDWNIFADIIGLDKNVKVETKVEEPVKKSVSSIDFNKVETIAKRKTIKEEIVQAEPQKVEEHKVETVKIEEPKVEETNVKETIVEEPKVEETIVEKPKTNEDKLAAIRAKLAAAKAKAGK